MVLTTSVVLCWWEWYHLSRVVRANISPKCISLSMFESCCLSAIAHTLLISHLSSSKCERTYHRNKLDGLGKLNLNYLIQLYF